MRLPVYATDLGFSTDEKAEKLAREGSVDFLVLVPPAVTVITAHYKYKIVFVENDVEVRRTIMNYKL